MKKTVDLTNEEIKKVTQYQKRKKLKSFSASIKSIIADMKSDEIPDDKFALIADALIKIDEKLNSMKMHIAPRNAGEVK